MLGGFQQGRPSTFLSSMDIGTQTFALLVEALTYYVSHLTTSCASSRVASLEDREYQMDRLEFVTNQLQLLIEDIKKKIKAVTVEVESKVNRGHRIT